MYNKYFLTALAFAGLFCLNLMSSCLAAPVADDLVKFNELERTLKELTTSILAMSGVAGSADNNADASYADGAAVYAVGALPDLNELSF